MDYDSVAVLRRCAAGFFFKSPADSREGVASTSGRYTDGLISAAPDRINQPRPLFSRRLAVDAAALAIVYLLFVIAFLPSVPQTRYDYDESDYMMSARMGFLANYLERPSMSLWEFVQTGLQKGVKGGANRSELSHSIRESRDVTFFRHYHGPLTFYWLSAVAGVAADNEGLMRAFGFLFHFFTVVTVYFACLAIAESRTAAIVGALMTMLSPTMIQTYAGQVSTHPVYVFVLMGALASMAAFLKTQRAGWWYAAVIWLGVAFCTLEYAVLLFPAYAAGLFAMRRDLFAGWERSRFLRWLGRSTGIFVATLVVLWPMGVFRLTMLEGFANLVYLAAFRKGSFGNETVIGHWAKRIGRDPVEFGAMILAIVLFVIVYRRKAHFRHLLLPFAVYAFLFWLTTIKNTSLNPRYISSLLPPLYVLAGVLIGGLLGKAPQAVRVAGVLAVALGIGYNSYARLLTTGQAQIGNPDLINEIANAGAGSHKLLVPWTLRPQIDYYFPNMTPYPYMPEEIDPSRLAETVTTGSYDGVICPRDLCRNLDAGFGPLVPLDDQGAAPSALFYRRAQR